MLTIIIPCYNPTSLLLETLNSLYNQSYSAFEIILIDDFSTNNFFKNNTFKNNVTVVRNKKNLGPGLSRNEGVKIAKTKYIMFLDSDDLVHNQCISIMLSNIEKLQSVAFGCNHIKFNKIQPTLKINSLNQPFKISRQKFVTLRGFAPWGIIFLRDFIKEHLFSDLRNAEDVYFTANYLQAKDGIYFLNEKLFFYRDSVAGSLTSNKEKHALAVSDAVVKINELLDKEFIKQLNLMLFTQFSKYESVFELSRRFQIELMSIKHVNISLYLNMLLIYFYIKSNLSIFYKLYIGLDYLRKLLK